MITVSENWTELERLEVIRRLAAKLRAKVQPPNFVIEISEVIELVAERPANFLQKNREQILEAIK